MPNIFKMPSWIVLIVSVVMFVTGWVWYDVIYGDAWVTLTQTTGAILTDS